MHAAMFVEELVMVEGGALHERSCPLVLKELRPLPCHHAAAYPSRRRAVSLHLVALLNF